MFLDECLLYEYPEGKCYYLTEFVATSMPVYKELKIKKVSHLPNNPEPNTIYLLLDTSTGKVSCYITERESQLLFKVGNQSEVDSFTPENYYLSRSGM